jgi:hypothetical protein
MSTHGVSIEGKDARVGVARFAGSVAPGLDASTNRLRRCVARLLTIAFLGLFGVGLSSTALNRNGLTSGLDMKRVGPVLGMTTVSMALLATWLAFMRWREDHDLLSGRLAAAIPCLVWASQSISSPVLLTEPLSRQEPSILRMAAGVVGTLLVVVDLARPERPFLSSLRQRLVAALLASVVAGGLTASVLRRPRLFIDVRQLSALRVFPVLWMLLGAALLVRGWRSGRALRRSLGLAVVLLAVAQVVGAPVLTQNDSIRAFSSGCLGLTSVVVLLGGLGYNLQEAASLQRARLVAAQFDVAQNANRLDGERLSYSLKSHDQKAALLAIEAVIGLLDRRPSILHPELVSATPRHKSSNASARRARGNFYR